MHSPLTRRVVALALGTIVVAAGLVVHAFFPGGFTSDAVGDILYAVLMYLLVVLVAPRAHPLLAGAIALAWCAAVEFFQLTGLPEAWAVAFPPLVLVFGTVFGAQDLAMYAVGIAGASVLDLVIKSLAGSGRRVEAETVPPPEEFP
ncbi:MAG TPA: DUF2809 domain-containing protein [Microbacterium sp.]|uniref:ribosomal maturation YjgA family protein n=1 Tax=Microbacterium sp. TaxID=51671 RepID=UPI002C2BA7A5|nr:DUF2809 domain-containing protein [Microbacterium sp.]HWI30386.1 DUF2809 domain-containing protein [Microbacterium sp.]